eukprot:ctg_1126.g436
MDATDDSKLSDALKNLYRAAELIHVDPERAGAPGQWASARIPGLPGALERRPRAYQRRLALPPLGVPGRGERAGVLDDIQVRRGQLAVWRRQGRRVVRSALALAHRDGAAVSGVRPGHCPHHWTAAGYPGTRCVHQRAGDGLDHGRVQQRERRWMLSSGDYRQGGGSGGSEGRGDATGRGAYYLMKEMEKSTHSDVLGGRGHKITVAVQGFGNAGQYISKFLYDDGGYVVVAVSDSRDAVYCASGVDVDKCIEVKNRTGRLKAADIGSAVRTMTNAELLTLEVDVLIPSAIEGVITAQNVAQVKAKLVVEVANGPVTTDADRQLASRGVTVVPDILANAGGVIVSYFEWVQGMSGMWWPEAEVHQRLQKKIAEEYHGLVRMWEQLRGKHSGKGGAFVDPTGHVIDPRQNRRTHTLKPTLHLLQQLLHVLGEVLHRLGQCRIRRLDLGAHGGVGVPDERFVTGAGRQVRVLFYLRTTRVHSVRVGCPPASGNARKSPLARSSTVVRAQHHRLSAHCARGDRFSAVPRQQPLFHGVLAGVPAGRCRRTGGAAVAAVVAVRSVTGYVDGPLLGHGACGGAGALGDSRTSAEVAGGAPIPVTAGDRLYLRCPHSPRRGQSSVANVRRTGGGLCEPQGRQPRAVSALVVSVVRGDGSSRNSDFEGMHRAVGGVCASVPVQATGIRRPNSRHGATAEPMMSRKHDATGRVVDTSSGVPRVCAAPPCRHPPFRGVRSGRRLRDPLRTFSHQRFRLGDRPSLGGRSTRDTRASTPFKRSRADPPQLCLVRQCAQRSAVSLPAGAACRRAGRPRRHRHRHGGGDRAGSGHESHRQRMAHFGGGLAARSPVRLPHRRCAAHHTGSVRQVRAQRRGGHVDAVRGRDAGDPGGERAPQHQRELLL